MLDIYQMISENHWSFSILVCCSCWNYSATLIWAPVNWRWKLQSGLNYMEISATPDWSYVYKLKNALSQFFGVITMGLQTEIKCGLELGGSLNFVFFMGQLSSMKIWSCACHLLALRQGHQKRWPGIYLLLDHVPGLVRVVNCQYNWL